MLTRRHFVMTTAALFSAPVASPVLANTWPTESQKVAWDAQVTPPGFDPATSNPGAYIRGFSRPGWPRKTG